MDLNHQPRAYEDFTAGNILPFREQGPYHVPPFEQ